MHRVPLNSNVLHANFKLMSQEVMCIQIPSTVNNIILNDESQWYNLGFLLCL